MALLFNLAMCKAINTLLNMTSHQFTLTNPVHFLALGFGSGLIRPAPGTWGTLASIPVYFALLTILPNGLVSYGLMLLATFLVGIYVCAQAAKDVGVHDHGAIVWDEFVGYFITMTLVDSTWQNVLIGFVLFRIFDIVKPWPIKLLDKHVHGGFGIMIDDVLAGIFAGLILYFMQAYIPF